MTYPSEPRHAAVSETLPMDEFTCHLSCWGPSDAPLVILLHGWGDTGSSFQFVAEALDGACRLIAPDWRGFGRSDIAGQTFWFPDYLRDLDRVLDRLSPDAPVRLVGHSMGANVASLYAGVRPGRILEFLNIEGFGLPDTKPEDAPDRYLQWLDRQKSPRPFRSYPDFAALAAGLRQRFPGLDAVRADFVAHCWGEESAGMVRLRAHPAHKLPNPVLYRRAEAEACWRRISARTRLLTGTSSEFATAQTINSVLTHIPSVDHVSVDGAGHMLHFDAPDEVARQIKSFLRL